VIEVGHSTKSAPETHRGEVADEGGIVGRILRTGDPSPKRLKPMRATGRNR
jgi:hypothetical protein